VKKPNFESAVLASGQNAPKAAVPQGFLAIVTVLALLVFAAVFW